LEKKKTRRPTPNCEYCLLLPYTALLLSPKYRTLQLKPKFIVITGHINQTKICIVYSLISMKINNNSKKKN
jgi:hypothetical protein